jgi:hypothetical protein
MKRIIYFLTLVPFMANALPIGDTQGVVSAVRVRNYTAGVQAFEIWFSSTSNDRFGCIQSDGYVLVSEAGSAMTGDNYKRLFAIALAAQVSGKVLAVDSGLGNPCTNVNVAWMVG